MQFAPELEEPQAFNPSQLWIRMQFAPELEEPQAFNWFADELVLVVVGKRVLIQATSLYMYKLGSQTSQVVVYMKKAFQSEELFGDDKAGSRRPDWPAGARTVSDSMIEASSGGRCDSDYK